jgi:hypothetical protein
VRSCGWVDLMSLDVCKFLFVSCEEGQVHDVVGEAGRNDHIHTQRSPDDSSVKPRRRRAGVIVRCCYVLESLLARLMVFRNSQYGLLHIN